MKNITRSLKFRLWLTLFTLAAGVLAAVYLNQKVLLPRYYEEVRRENTINAANFLKNYWEENSTSPSSFFNTLQGEIIRLARTYDLYCIIQVEYNSLLGKRYYCYAQDGMMYSQDIYSALLYREMFEKAYLSENYIITDKITEDNYGRIPSIRTFIISETKNSMTAYITVQCYASQSASTSSIANTQFIMISIILIASACILAIYIAIKISRPIVKMAEMANKLPIGEFNFESSKRDMNEVKILAENLNSASYEIAKTDKLRNDLFANVSHDLRTPLTMIRAYAEKIRDITGSDPQKRETDLDIIISETMRLNSLVTDIMSFTKLQNKIETLNTSVFNLSKRLEEIVMRIGNMPENNIRINKNITENIFICGDITKIEQVIYNLIYNAIVHSNKEDIYVNLYIVGDTKSLARFEVIDKGEGIPEKFLNQIWDKYFKAEKSETHKRSSLGSGLGLSIVKNIMELHKFPYGVFSKENVGSTFWFEFYTTKNE